MLSSADMERVLESLDRRLNTVEQILPTLATKIDLKGFATKADLERFATKADLEQFATKDDLERFATKADLDELKRHTDMRFEDLRDDLSKVAEGVASIALTVQANQTTLQSVVNRLDTHDDVLKALVRKHGI